MRFVYVAMGSNLAAEERLSLAAGMLRARFPGARFSPCYRNAAHGFEGPDFINAVVELPVDEPLMPLLETLRSIEERCGRARRAPRWASRAMDLDLLLDGQTVARTDQYTLPRPDLLRRSYMLAPMADLAPGFHHPTAGQSIGELLAALPGGREGMRRIALDLNHP